MTIADICDQYIDYQDKLYDNENGRLEFRGDNWGALWPGTCKPGLWMNAASRLGVVYNLILREEELYTQERNKMGETIRLDRDEEIALVIPPAAGLQLLHQGAGSQGANSCKGPLLGGHMQ
jgi:hypothetical protein